MKCLVINGSPAKEYMWNKQPTTSFTNKLVDEVIRTMNLQEDVSVKRINLKDEDIPFCRGCCCCFNEGEESCPYSNKIQKIIDEIKSADCLILTSPVYSLNVTAVLKSFLDLTSYNYHRPSFFEKKALVISSTAGGGAKFVCKYLAQTLTHWGFNRVYKLPIIKMGATKPNSSMKRKCKKIALKFYQDVRFKGLHSPSFKQLFYYQLWRGMSVNSSCRADKLYWENTSLLEYPYYPKIKLSTLKKIYSQIMVSLFKKI